MLSNLNGQSFQYGIGVHANFGYLVFEDKSPFDAIPLQPSISLKPGISLFAEFQTSKAFQIRIAGQINEKTIQLSQRVNGGRFKNSIDYLFLAFDGHIIAKYLLAGKENWQYFPSLGFNIGFHQDLGYEITNGISAGTANGLAIGLNPTENQSFINATIQLGIGVKPPFTVLKLLVELNCHFLYSPSKFLKDPIVINPLVIQGKYHSLSIGLNFYLRRLKA